MTQTENEVEDDVIRWLRKRGWVLKRQHVGVYYTRDGRPVSIGERGACDWIAVRWRRGLAGEPGIIDYLEFEAKRTKAKPAKVQEEYMANMRHMGFTCIWADSLVMFREKYWKVYGGAE